MNPMITDLKNAIVALECMIIDLEEDAIKHNAGESTWSRIEEYRTSLNNFKLLKSIYS